MGELLPVAGVGMMKRLVSAHHTQALTPRVNTRAKQGQGGTACKHTHTHNKVEWGAGGGGVRLLSKQTQRGGNIHAKICQYLSLLCSLNAHISLKSSFCVIKKSLP